MNTRVGIGPAARSVRWTAETAARLDALFDAVTFPTATSLRFGDAPPIDFEGISDRVIPDRLVDALWPLLYDRGYARSYRPDGSVEIPTTSRPDPGFLARLSKVHASQTRWNPAWKVEWVGNDGSIRARKGESSRFAPPGQYAFGADPNRPPRPGDFVDLFSPRESFVAQPGFYFAYGETLGCDNDNGRVTRVYYHATAAGMPEILASLSTLLNRYGVPFLLKCRDDPAHFDRADAAVLFVSARFLSIVLRLMQEIEEVLNRHLRPGTPLFTKELRPGLGFADNLTISESFGYNRCLLVARGLVEAHVAGQHGREARHNAVASHFVRAGLDPASPHLGPGLSDPYCWPEPEPWLSQIVSIPHSKTVPESTPFLEAANRIGQRLCRDAIWAADRCNWMAWTTEKIAARPTPVYRAAPPDLADGVAGIALFLVQLQQFTGDQQQRIILGGAIRQLLARFPSWKTRAPASAMIGVGHALVTIGEITHQDNLIREGIELMGADQASAEIPGDWQNSARAIAPLIDVAIRYQRDELLELARKYGQILSQLTNESSRDRTGRGRNMVDELMIAAALLELNHTTPDLRWSLAVSEILVDHQGKIDTASMRSRLSNAGRLDYLRILEFCDDKSTVSIGLEEIIQADISSLEGFQGPNMSLGSGLTGIAAFILHAAEALNRSELKDAAERFGQDAINYFDRPQIPWPCGVPNAGETPNLMLGLAGIGLFYLRLHAPQGISSPLSF